MAPARLSSVLPVDLRWLDIAASDADSVELKMLLEPGADVATTLCGPGARRRSRRLYLIDTPDLALSDAGVDLRLRRRAGGRHDLSVRSRRRGRLRDRVRPPGSRVELDLLPGTVLRTTELRRLVAPDLVTRCLAGALAPGRLLYPAQLEWLARWLGRRPAALLDALAVHGPVAVSRMRVPPGRFPSVGAPFVRAFVEHAVYPSGRELTEFSVRCHPAQAAEVAAAADRFLAALGAVPARRHHTKSSCWAAEVTGLSA